jgi:GT2 family glycosyltransferase
MPMDADQALRVSAVVLNYDGRELLATILPTLAAQTVPPDEVIVVDNGSSDDSVEYLRREWPAVRIEEIPENVGVTRALNRGVAAARGGFVALLNNDIELEPGWLAELLDALECHPEAGSAACRLRNYYRRGELDGAGDIFTRGGAGTKRGHRTPDDGRFGAEEEVLAPTGGAGLYRAAALADVGPFEESFRAYFEDLDWGLRALGRGYRSRYVPGAIGYHMEGRTTGGTTNPVYHALQWRNTIAVIVRNIPLRWVLSNAPWIVRHHAAGLLASARAGMLRSHLAGYLAAFRATPRWLAERRSIRARRTLSRAGFEAGLAAGRHEGTPVHGAPGHAHGPEPRSLALVHLIWAPEGSENLEGFLSAYRSHAAGREHRLVALCNGFSGPDDPRMEAIRAALAGVEHELVMTPAPVQDLAAYLFCARQLNSELVCFLNSYSRPLVDRWLANLAGALDAEGIGMAGTGGSYESAYSAAPIWLRLRRRARFPAFPNPHLRTNGFILERELLLSLDAPGFGSKVDAWAFESGSRSISRQISERGLELVVVGADGIAYPQQRWRESATFRAGEQRNLLIADNRTEQYARADAGMRARLERMAWGQEP